MRYEHNALLEEAKIRHGEDLTQPKSTNSRAASEARPPAVSSDEVQRRAHGRPTSWTRLPEKSTTRQLAARGANPPLRPTQASRLTLRYLPAGARLSCEIVVWSRKTQPVVAGEGRTTTFTKTEFPRKSKAFEPEGDTSHRDVPLSAGPPRKARTWPDPPTLDAVPTTGTSCRFGWGNERQKSMASPSSVSASGPEARRRLVEELDWALEIVDAPDLESLGAIFDRRLRAYVAARVPDDERELSAAKHSNTRSGLSWFAPANVAFSFRPHFPELPTNWGSFVDQNKAAENEFAKSNMRRRNSSGADLASADGADKFRNLAVLPASPVLAPFDPRSPGPGRGPVPDRVRQAFRISGDRTGSAASAQPRGKGCRGRQHCLRGFNQKDVGRSGRIPEACRPQAPAQVQFAIDFLGDPRMNELTEEKWKLLDEALPDIPKRNKNPSRVFEKPCSSATNTRRPTAGPTRYV